MERDYVMNTSRERWEEEVRDGERKGKNEGSRGVR